jgi:diguanylate cyclase (GGDEF)-like protein
MVETRIPEEYLFAGTIYRLIRRHLSWFLIDLMTTFTVVMGVGLLWRSQRPLNWGVVYFSLLAVVLSLLFSGINTTTGLNRVGWSRATLEDGMRLLAAGMVMSAFIILLNTLHMILHWPPFPALPTGMLLTITIMAQIGFITTRYRWRLLSAAANFWLSIRRHAAMPGERVLIIGAGEGVETVTWLLRRKWLDYAFSIVGIVDDDNPSQYGMRVNGCLMLGKIGELAALVQKHDIGLIFVTLSESHPEVIKALRTVRSVANLRIVFLNTLIKMIDQQLKYSGFVQKGVNTKDEGWEFLSMYDQQTGLPNQLLFHDRLQHSLAISRRANTNLAVFHIDLNGNKKKLDIRAMEFGKIVLCEAADRLSQNLRECDTLACLGKNEFALILENIGDQKCLQAVSNRICKALAEPFQVEDDHFRLHAKVKCYLNKDIEKSYLQSNHI